MIADLAIAGDHVGFACLISAKMPATCGLDMDVPLIDWNSSPGDPRVAVGVFPARMFTPGAVTSGLMMSAFAGDPTGPLDEKSAMLLPGALVLRESWIAAVAPVVDAM